MATAANLGYAVGREHDVVLIDRNPFHVYMPSLLMAMTEERRGDQLVRDLSRLERQHVRVLRDTIRAIDPERRRVELENGSLGYDYLVISLGLATHPEAIPGFVEAGGHHAWELDAALRCRDALQTFTGGRLVVALSPGLYRCPPAPYETLFSLDTLLTRRRVRANTELIYLAPGPRPTGEPDNPFVWLDQHATERGVTTHLDFPIERVDPERRQVVAQDGRTQDDDFLFVIPPHRPAEVLIESGLAGQTGISVDVDTLQTRWEDVWAIGDAVDFPASKAGVVAHQQGDFVAHTIAGRLNGRADHARFKLHTT